MDTKTAEIEQEYKFYQQNGEQHPLYANTWKIFWEKRYKELKKEGKNDPEKYDYTNDWVKYWMEYLRDFYENKIKFYKERNKKKLAIQLSPISISSSQSSDKNKGRRYSSSSDDSISPKKPKKYARSFSPISSEEWTKVDNEVITLLSLCRTLIVLDTELGSLLSNKIVDMTAQSIELEKIQANSSEEIILSNSENITFLGIVKEKLKGLLSTNLLEHKKIPIAKKCIQNIAQIIHQHPIKANVKTNDNSKLADIITKALVYFGKNDTSPAELEVITDIYLEELEKNIELAQYDRNESNFSKPSTICYQVLSDDELKVLIKNFPRLSETEQDELLSFIKQMEVKDPERINKLQNFFDNEGNNPKQIKPTIVLDDDEDDYNFDELVATIK